MIGWPLKFNAIKMSQGIQKRPNSPFKMAKEEIERF